MTEMTTIQCHIPFVHHGRSGRVAVSYTIDDDPIRAGFDIIPGLSFDVDLCRGYPVIHARIADYEGEGYRALYGWIQVVTNEYTKYDSSGQITSEKNVLSDVVPSMQDCGIPFACLGILPQFFDAPCRNLGDNSELRWYADTFLATVPMRSKEEEISWLLGFRWGYIENDKGGKQPVSILPLEASDGNSWNMHLPVLRNIYPDWKFKNA